MGEFSSIENRGRIAIITLNRPEVLNAMHPPADEELYKIWQDFAQDDSRWVAIVTGAGERAFSAGADLKWGKDHGGLSAGEPRAPFAGFARRIGDKPFQCSKPIIAAVNGLALGGGMEACLSSDIVIADESARFGLPEVRWSLVPGAGGVEWLVRQIPLKIAMGVLLTGGELKAEEALKYGLVNEVVPKGSALDKALEWGERILSCGPLAVRAVKEAAYGGLGFPYEFAHNRVWESIFAVRNSLDVEEGVRAFQEKRAPIWQGR